MLKTFMLRVIVFLFLVTSIASCKDCNCVPSDGLRLGLISFDSTEINTIVIRKFEKGSGFNHLIDTSLFDNGTNIFYPKKDTFEMGAFPGNMPLKSNFDYEINVPLANRTYQVTEMNEPQVEGNCQGKTMCVNEIVSCKLNGSFVSTDDRQTLYLKK